MGKLFKLGFKVFIALVAVVIICVIALFSTIKNAAKEGTARAVSFVLDAPVSIEDATVQPLTGSVVLTGFVVGNPEDFDTASAFQVDRVDVKVDLMSFRSDEIVIEKIEMEAPKITLEQALTRSNLSQLVKNAQRFSTGSEEAEDHSSDDARAEETARKTIRIDKIIVDDPQVAVSAPILRGQELAFDINDIELNEIGGKEKEVLVSEAIEIFFHQILTQALNDGGEVMPPDLHKSFSGSLSELGVDYEEVRQGIGGFIEKHRGKIDAGIKKTEEGIRDLLGRGGDAEE